MATQKITKITGFVSLGAPIIYPNLLTITPLMRTCDCVSRGQDSQSIMLDVAGDRNLDSESREGGAAPGPPRLSPGRQEHRKFSRTYFMPPEVVTVFTQTINKYGTSLTFH